MRRSPLLIVFLTVFIDLLGFGIVLPLLPVYSKAYGAGELTLGLLFASFSALQFLCAPFWGRVSDRVGRRPVLLGGLLGTAASYLLFAYANSLPLLFLSRMLAGFFGANVGTAQAYIADVTTPANRAKGMGLIGAAFGLGFTVGPLVGGELSALAPQAPGLAAAGLSLSAALFGYFLLAEPAGARAGGRVFGFGELRRALAAPRLRTLFLLNFLAIVGFSAFESMFTRFGLARFPDVFRLPEGIAAATTADVLAAAPIAGRYLAFIGVLSALIQGGLIRRLVPRFGEWNLIVAGPFLLGSSFLVVGLAPTWGVVLLGCALMPFGFGINNPALNGLISRAAPAAEQGAYLGLNQSVASLARMTGPPLAGSLFAWFGPAAPFLSAAALLFGASALAAHHRARRRYWPP